MRSQHSTSSSLKRMICCAKRSRRRYGSLLKRDNNFMFYLWVIICHLLNIYFCRLRSKQKLTPLWRERKNVRAPKWMVSHSCWSVSAPQDVWRRRHACGLRVPKKHWREQTYVLFESLCACACVRACACVWGCACMSVIVFVVCVCVYICACMSVILFVVCVHMCLRASKMQVNDSLSVYLWGLKNNIWHYVDDARRSLLSREVTARQWLRKYSRRMWPSMRPVTSCRQRRPRHWKCVRALRRLPANAIFLSKCCMVNVYACVCVCVCA